MVSADEGPESQLGTLGIDPKRFSSLVKLLRVTALCLRFIKKLKKQKPVNPSLDAPEIQSAQHLWVKHIQKKHFSDVFEAISKGKRVPLQNQLNLFVNEEGILRCKGRLANAKLETNAVFPILLPKKDWFTTLVIRSFHAKLFHSGTAHTLSQIRHTFWIPSGRSIVCQEIKSCLKCKKVEGGPYKPPPTPPFPISRVQESTPFTWTGLDYLGPLYVKRGQESGKTWICLFTCMATRAIHLELVEDLSADQFLLCLRRFIARRGAPSHILSDNAAQFKLAQSAVEDLWMKATRDDKVLSYVSNLGIKWTFIPERAPWMGGVYERLVQLVKRALRKSLQHLCLKTVQLQTVLTEVEAMLNSRPLVHVGSDLHDGQTLTPAHLLLQNPKLGVPDMSTHDATDPDFIDQITSKDALLQRWKKGEQHLQTFWKVWRDEYLLSLRERRQQPLKGSSGAVHHLPKVGDIVHIRQETSRGTWPLAKVVQLITSADGEIRAAKVQMANGNVLNRAILHLYPLELRDEQISAPEESQKEEINAKVDKGSPTVSRRPQRKAAAKARERIQAMAEESDDEPIDSVPIRPHPTRPSVALFMLGRLITLMLPVITAQPIICEKGGAKMVIDLGQTQACTFNQDRNIDEVFYAKVQVFKKNIAQYSGPAYKCSKVTTISQAYTNFAVAGWDHSTTEEPVIVSETECTSIIRDRRCSEGPLLGGDLASFTENKVSPPYTSGQAWNCCKWVTAKVTNCFLLKGKVFKTFGGQMESNLGNVIDCSYEKGSCTLPDHGTLVWTPEKNTSCEYVYWKTIEGKTWNNQFFSSDMEIAMTWNQGQQTSRLCDGTMAILTDQGIPVVVTRTSLFRYRSAQDQRDTFRRKRESDISDAIAMRLQALEVRLDSLFKESLNHAFTSVCRAIQELQEIDLVLAHSEPSLIARRLLNDSMIIARLYGQFLEVWPCNPVDQYEFLKMGDKCTEWIPLNFTVCGTSSRGYIDPKASIIYANSAPVDCDLAHEMYLRDPDKGLLVYTAHNGVVKPFKGELVKHSLHSAKVMSHIDFTAVIHKPIQLYTQRELRAQSSMNDLFAAIDSHAEVLRQLGQVEHGSPKSCEAKAIIDTLSNLTPWGLLSSWASKLLSIWMYACCTLVTLQFLGSRIMKCLIKRWRKRAMPEPLYAIPTIQPVATMPTIPPVATIPPRASKDMPPSKGTLAEIVKATLEEA